MMEELIKQLTDKLISTHTDISKPHEDLFNAANKEIANIKNKDHAQFFKQSLSDAKSGKINIDQFMKNFNNLKDVS